MAKQRLDQYLFESGLTDSRNRAQALIMQGKVRVNGEKIVKAGFPVPPQAKVELEEDFPYVSRGALKILKALDTFPIQVANRVAIDIGSSTGGFTQVLLERGASKVYAVDSGTNQLHYQLRTHPKVTVMEQTNARYLEPSQFDPLPDIAVIDVSFISLSLIFPVVRRLGCLEVAALIKPQFEVGKEVKNFDGVVKKTEDRQKAIEKVQLYASENHYQTAGITESPITGPKGNVEYLIYLIRQSA